MSSKIEENACYDCILYAKRTNPKVMKKLNRTKSFFKQTRSRFWGACILGIVFILAFTANGHAQKSVIPVYIATVVLDPGHGGHDKGAQGSGGIYEKTVSLNLARKVADALGRLYRVVLTRTDDYGVDVAERAATANHLKADLFVSLHTGGSFLHNAGGMAVYYFEKTYQAISNGEIPEQKQMEGQETATRWDIVQEAHIHASRSLAEQVQARLQNHVKPTPCKITGAPLLVLRGADMPAILIETGYLTNPMDEKMLQDPDMLAGLADVISRAIIEYIQKTQ